MKLKKRNGHWYVWHSRTERPPNGKLVSIKSILGYAVNKTQAESFFREYKKDEHQQQFANVLQVDIQTTTLSDLAEKYTTGERSDLSKATLNMDKKSIRNLIQSIGDKKTGAVRKDDLIKFKDDCLARGLSPASIRSYFRHLKAMMTWAANNGIINAAPAFPQVKAPQRLPQIIPAKHLGAIMAYTKKHDYQVWRYAHFSLHTGCRISEALNLRWQDVEIYKKPTAAGTIGRVQLIGKGDKQRTVPLLPDTLESLGEIKDIGPVFQQWLVGTTSRHFKACVRNAAEKFPEDSGFEAYHFHCLRHTAATNMLEKGLRLETIQKILGHVNASTTQIYAHVLDDFLEEEMGKMVGQKKSVDKVPTKRAKGP